jgi:cytochrome oxidase Cu insertion factor (SCO1/SenC/PrrC family)
MKYRALIIAMLMFLVQALYCQKESSRPVPVELKVPNIEVIDQQGQHLRLNSDLIKNRTAVISSFFTTCTSFCPLTQQNLGRLAKVLGKRMGNDVVFISVSIDPVNDTPARMKEWSEKFHTGPGWTLASGSKSDIETLLKSLGLYVELAGRHQSAVIIGNPGTGWTRASIWAEPEKLQKVIDGGFSSGHTTIGDAASAK